MKRGFSTCLMAICFIIATSCAQDKKDQVVTIKTKYGDMVAILFDETPKHKANFIKLAKEHFFDSTLFHRVMPGFMIQGGDPESKKAVVGQALGRGGPGYTIEAEINPKFFHERGMLAAARMGDAQNPKKASNGSQFYIVQGRVLSEDEMTIDQRKYDQALKKFFENPANKSAYDSLTTIYQTGGEEAFRKLYMSLKPRVVKETGMDVTQVVDAAKLKAYSTVGGTPMLDGSYTIFGRVIKGLEVMDKITALPRDNMERPAEDVAMTVTVEEMSKKKIEKQYGYEYP